MRGWKSLVCVIAVAAACDGSGFAVANRDDLASLAQAIPQGYCCRIPEGQAAEPIGSVEVDPDPDLAFLPLGPARHLGVALDEVTPPGVLEFTWNGPFIATAHLDENPNSVPMPFDPETDIGGFRGTRTLSFSATSCAFEHASFVLVVFEYETWGPDSGDEPDGLFGSPFLGRYRIVSRQRQRVEIANCEATPEPPPPEDQIAFARTRPGQAGEIWTTSLDGNESQLTDDIHGDIGPAWSSDRTRIAFSSGRGAAGTYELYTRDADGTDIQPATAFGNRWVEDPAWSPGGTTIAVSVGLPGMPDKDLWIVDTGQPLGPGNPRQLTQGTQRDTSPSWSPDGTRIAFVRDGNIHVVPADGSAPPASLITGISATSVDWSSQDELVFSRYDTTFIAWRIWKADADGTNAVLVTDGEVGRSDLSPSWSPDGTRVAFVRERVDPEGEVRLGAIYVVGSDGSGEEAVTDEEDDDDRDPDW